MRQIVTICSHSILVSEYPSELNELQSTLKVFGRVYEGVASVYLFEQEAQKYFLYLFHHYNIRHFMGVPHTRQTPVWT